MLLYNNSGSNQLIVSLNKKFSELIGKTMVIEFETSHISIKAKGSSLSTYVYQNSSHAYNKISFVVEAIKTGLENLEIQIVFQGLYENNVYKAKVYNLYVK